MLENFRPGCRINRFLFNKIGQFGKITPVDCLGRRIMFKIVLKFRKVLEQA